jgi:hypothetical protein
MKVSAIACPDGPIPVMLPSHWCSKKLCTPSWSYLRGKKIFHVRGLPLPLHSTQRGITRGATRNSTPLFPPCLLAPLVAVSGAPYCGYFGDPPRGPSVRTLEGFPTRSSPGSPPKRGPLQCFPRLWLMALSPSSFSAAASCPGPSDKTHVEKKNSSATSRD